MPITKVIPRDNPMVSLAYLATGFKEGERMSAFWDSQGAKSWKEVGKNWQAIAEFHNGQKGRTKTRGKNTHYEIIISLDPSDPGTEKMSNEDILSLGRGWADQVLKNEHAYAMFVHRDHDHPHLHLVFQAINLLTGKKFRDHKGAYAEYSHVTDELAEKHFGLRRPVRERALEKHNRVAIEMDARGEISLVLSLKRRINEAKHLANDIADFEEKLGSMGIRVAPFRASSRYEMDYTDDALGDTVFKCRAGKLGMGYEPRYIETFLEQKAIRGPIRHDHKLFEQALVGAGRDVTTRKRFGLETPVVVYQDTEACYKAYQTLDGTWHFDREDVKGPGRRGEPEKLLELVGYGRQEALEKLHVVTAPDEDTWTLARLVDLRKYAERFGWQFKMRVGQWRGERGDDSLRVRREKRGTWRYDLWPAKGAPVRGDAIDFAVRQLGKERDEAVKELARFNRVTMREVDLANQVNLKWEAERSGWKLAEMSLEESKLGHISAWHGQKEGKHLFLDQTKSGQWQFHHTDLDGVDVVGGALEFGTEVLGRSKLEVIKDYAYRTVPNQDLFVARMGNLKRAGEDLGFAWQADTGPRGLAWETRGPGDETIRIYRTRRGTWLYDTGKDRGTAEQFVSRYSHMPRAEAVQLLSRSRVEPIPVKPDLRMMALADRWKLKLIHINPYMVGWAGTHEKRPGESLMLLEDGGRWTMQHRVAEDAEQTIGGPQAYLQLMRGYNTHEAQAYLDRQGETLNERIRARAFNLSGILSERGWVGVKSEHGLDYFRMSGLTLATWESPQGWRWKVEAGMGMPPKASGDVIDFLTFDEGGSTRDAYRSLEAYLGYMPQSESDLDLPELIRMFGGHLEKRNHAYHGTLFGGHIELTNQNGRWHHVYRDFAGSILSHGEAQALANVLGPIDPHTQGIIAMGLPRYNPDSRCDLIKANQFLPNSLFDGLLHIAQAGQPYVGHDGQEEEDEALQRRRKRTDPDIQISL